MENLKRCTKCGEEKELDKFYKNKTHKDSLSSECKICILKRTIEWYKNNPEKAKINRRNYYKNNPEKAKMQAKKWRENNPKKVKEKNKRYYQKNLEKIKKYKKEWEKNNREKINENHKKYCKNNSDKIKKIQAKYKKNNIEKIRIYNIRWYRNNLKRKKEVSRKWMENNREKYNKQKCDRRKIDIQFKLKGIISSLIRMRLKNRLLSKNGKSTFSFLPYTVDELKQHLESLFQPWMNWKNYGNKAGMWCIDHRYPDSSFDYKSVEDDEFQKCWALENLQPMEFIKNIKKSDKLIYE